MRKGIKPASTPMVGSFWRFKISKKARLYTGQDSSWYDVVAVMDVKAGYARMGMRSDVVEYTSGLAYAVDDSKLKMRYKKNISRDSFFELFDQITDMEEVSEILGMLALQYYG